EPERERLLEQRGELDALVAAHARVRGAACGVLGDEVVDHVGAAALGEVPHVERDAELPRGAAGAERALDRAAAPPAGAPGSRRAEEGEGRAHRLPPGLLGARGRDGPGDATGQPCQDLHPARERGLRGGWGGGGEGRGGGARATWRGEDQQGFRYAAF